MSVKRFGHGTMMCFVGAALAVACAGKSGDTSSLGDAGVAQDETAGSAGRGGTGGAGGAGFEPCDRSSPTAEAGATGPLTLGFSSIYKNPPLEGRVKNILEDRMELETQPGPLTFYWRGPSLASAFEVGETVHIDLQYGGVPNSASWSIVRSERATATAVGGSDFVAFGTSPGSTATLQRLEPGFPELVYHLVSCCTRGPGGAFGRGPELYTCDYSALEAQLDGDSATIARGATAGVGPWSITNVQSDFSNGFETYWSLQVTMLGPATPRSADAGI